MKLKLGVISSNMDTVTGPAMASAMYSMGAISALHRFQSIEQNTKQFLESSNPNHKPIVSLGLGKKELERAEALYSVGANVFLIDVAHGANIEVVKQVISLRELLHPSAQLIVGNFATAKSIEEFEEHAAYLVQAYKIGIGGGGACSTRVVTGCGWPTFSSIRDCSRVSVPIIADGGVRNSGDFAKCFAAGASAVMLGGLLAGTDESPGSIVYAKDYAWTFKPEPGNKFAFKNYRGSASAESYEAQGKVASHRSAEGEAFLVPYVGPVEKVIQQLDGGLRSAMSYVGARTLKEFKENAEFVETSRSGSEESRPHGKRNAG